MSRARDFADLAGSADAGGLTGRNIVINGACQVAQRSTSVTGLGASHDSYDTVDRFKLLTGSDATAGRFTMSQSSVTDLAGFSNAIKLQCTTADTSIAAGEACVLSTVFEGQDLQRLLNTSTSTKAFTVSFYAKANESRAVALEVRTSHGTNRQIAKLFTITSSWQRFEFNVPASASGMQFGNDTTNDLQLNWWQHAGSTYAGGTLSTDWEGATTANRAAGVGSLFASTNNFFEITGIQLEVGEQATPFEHRSYGDELARCQRYFVRFDASTQGDYARIGLAVQTSATLARGSIPLPVPMRTEPSSAYSGTARIEGTSAKNLTALGQSGNSSIFNLGCDPTFSSSGASGDFGFIDTGADGKIDADAEL